jgi:hypothetical protein
MTPAMPSDRELLPYLLGLAALLFGLYYAAVRL